MAAELGWSPSDIQAAMNRPAFFEGVVTALRAKALAPTLERLNVHMDPAAPPKQRMAIMQAQGERARLLRLLKD